MARSMSGSDRIDWGDQTDFEPGSGEDFCMCGWIRSSDTSSDMHTFVKLGGGIGFRSRTANSSSPLDFAVDSGPRTTIQALMTRSTMCNGTWRPIRMYRSNSGNDMGLDISGSNEASATSITDTGSLANSAALGTSQGGFEIYQGDMACVTFFMGTELSDEQAASIANGCHPLHVIDDDSVVNLMAELDGNDSPEPDISGNDYDGTLTGTSLVLDGPDIEDLGYYY